MFMMCLKHVCGVFKHLAIKICVCVIFVKKNLYLQMHNILVNYITFFFGYPNTIEQSIFIFYKRIARKKNLDI